MTAWISQADAILRGRATPEHQPVQRTLGLLLACTVTAGMIYGGVMGSFGGVAGERLAQVFYSATKVPLLLIATFALSLPSFFVLNTLFGLRADFAAVLRALLAAQAALTVILVSLAPYTAFWYVSFAGYQVAVLFNALMFLIASLAAQYVLRGYYTPLIARNPRHRLMFRTWLLIYAFVGIQMGWVLRPFVGDPGSPVQFFRAESWGNAYVVVARMVWSVLSG